jgi:hypothetical protein
VQKLLEDQHAERGTISKATAWRILVRHRRAVERRVEGAALIERWACPGS